MKTILCYGDSNTWGYVPGSLNFETMHMERYPRHKRWTGILQNLLGHDYNIIEEGLNARTTNVDYKELYGRNGKTFLLPCLYTHSPLNRIILMLGLNDLKKEFNRSNQDINQGISGLIEIILQSKYRQDMQSPPKILLVSSPILVNETYSDDMFSGAMVRAQQFAKDFKKIADEYHCDFLDAAPHIQLSQIDGLHFDEKAHQTFAQLIYAELKN